MGVLRSAAIGPAVVAELDDRRDAFDLFVGEG